MARRLALDMESWQKSSLMAEKRLISSEIFRNASTVSLYSPVKNEIDTRLIFAACLNSGKRVLYPIVCGDSMVFREVRSEQQLSPGSFGIMEPCELAVCSPSAEADLMVVPGVAFDLAGHRLGFGKGYYDRYLAMVCNRPLLVGLCHDFQLCDRLPVQGHDIRMHYLFTEKRELEISVTDRQRRSDDHR